MSVVYPISESDTIQGSNETASPIQYVSMRTPAIVIVGTGPVGLHLVHELARCGVDTPVVLYGAEPWQPYDRVKLSSYLAGEIDRRELDLDTSALDTLTLEKRFNCPVVKINRDSRTIIDAEGREQRYAQLVLATGSKPFVPTIQNLDVSGVYTFRSLSEADQLFARTVRSKHTVVLGGGLLGLETARAMQRFNTDITIIEHNSWLMMQQLDQQGAELLRQSIESQGMNVILGNSVESVIGKQRIEGVRLRNGHKLDCDTLVIATGIRANMELARDAGLAGRRGISVNDELQTSDDNIYAIGECAEHNDQTYGLVKPGFDMAAVLADRLAGGDACYKGSVDATHLKVMREKVFSVGRTGVYDNETAAVREYVYESEQDGTYRKIRVHRDRLIGAVALGEWNETALLQDAITRQRRVWFWHLARFRQKGYLWDDEADADVLAWPASAIVCNCTGVTRGQLSNAMSSGCSNVECLTEQTRAGSICGSCKPILSQLAGQSAEREAVIGWRATLAASVFTLLFAAFFFSDFNIPYPDTVQLAFSWDVLWRDALMKQITGFSMLGLVAVGMLLSMRKRVSSVQWGNFNLWRIAHIALGVLALLMLVAHTGLRVGNEINFLLILNFLLLASIGALASGLISTEHLQSVAAAKRQRARWTWIHILMVWPLPVLLGFHILKTYYY